MVLLGATGTRAAADPVGDAKSQLATLQAEVESGATQIHQLAQAFDEANLQADSLGQQITSDELALASLRTRMAASEATLRNEALLSYTGGTTLAPAADEGPLSDPSIRDEYLHLAMGDVSESIDVVRLQQREIVTAEDALLQQQQARQQAALAASAARQAALSQAAGLQGQIVGLQSRLVTLERSASSEQARPAASATQGFPNGNGIVRVVTGMVGSPPETTTTTTTDPPPAVTSGGATSTTTAPSSGTSAYPWPALRNCESGGDYTLDTGNGYYGAYQFSRATWNALGYPGLPSQAPPAVQDEAAARLEAVAGWGQWPACARLLGLR
jgi:hypothetical protein